MQQQQLDEAQRELLRDIVQLAEEDKPVIIHENTTQGRALEVLSSCGFVEVVPVGDIEDCTYEAGPTLRGYNYLRYRGEE